MTRGALHIDPEWLAEAAWSCLEAGTEIPYIDIPEADARRAEVQRWADEVAEAYQDIADRAAASLVR